MVADPLARLEAEVIGNRVGTALAFERFYRLAWQYVDGAPLVWGWFPQLLCRELERWGTGKTRNLLIAVPPGLSKSLSASVILPAWMWLRQPSTQFLCCSHTQTLATRDCVRMRNLVRSEWYQSLIARRWKLKDDQDQKTYFANTTHGHRQSLGGNSNLAGWRGDCVIIDDPVDVNPRRPPRKEDLDNAHAWVQAIRSQRVNDPKTSRTLLIAQRSYPDDPSGRLLQEEPEEWRTVYFDLEYDPSMPFRHEADPRTKSGEILFPERFGEREVAQRKRALGRVQYQAQNQQQPAATAGNLIKRSLVEVITDPVYNYQHMLISWDLAFKGETTSSWVVGSVWGVNAPSSLDDRQFDLLDVYREQLDFVQTKTAVQRLAVRWPQCNYIVVEDKANGPALISELRHTLPNIVAFNPTPYGDKMSRLRAISPIIDQGRLRIVKDVWNETYLDEICAAPACRDWDQIDSTTQAILGSIHELPKWEQQTQRQSTVLGGW